MNSTASGNRLDRRLHRLQSPGRPWLIHLGYTPGTTVDDAALRAAVGRLEAARPELAVEIAPTIRLDTPVAISQGGIRCALAGDSIELAVNHALTDGLGALQVLRDLDRALAGAAIPRRCDVDDASLDRLPPTATADRVRTAASALRSIADRPRTAMATGPTRVVTRTVAMGDLDRRRPDHASRNEVIVAATHLALRDVLNGSGPTAVSVPIDLRRLIGEPDGIGNAVLNLSTRIPARVTTWSDVVATVADQIERQRAPRMLRASLDQALRALPPGEPRTRDRRRSLWRESGVCSNVGMVDDLPGLRFSPPAHELIAFGICGDSSRVTVTVRGRASRALLEAAAGTFVRSVAGER